MLPGAVARLFRCPHGATDLIVGQPKPVEQTLRRPRPRDTSQGQHDSHELLTKLTATGARTNVGFEGTAIAGRKLTVHVRRQPVENLLAVHSAPPVG